MSGYLVLSPTDKVILESYKILVDGLSAYLGEGYEIILHSLEDLDHSVIKIINGHYTERCGGKGLFQPQKRKDLEVCYNSSGR